MRTANLIVTDVGPEELSADTLILPTVADRIESSSFNRIFYERAGGEVLAELQTDLPLRIGNVAVTGGGSLSVGTIVHVPVRTAPDVPTTEENLQVGLRSGLVTADEEGVETVALAPILPEDLLDDFDLGTVTDTLREDLEQYPPRHFGEILLLTGSTAWAVALREAFP